jgi:hypothetical protein
MIQINLKKPDYTENYYENTSLNKGGFILTKENKETSFQPEPIPEPEPEPEYEHKPERKK